MKAFVCLVELRLHYNDSGSLKGKRKELHSLKAQLRKRFGASVAEVDGHDTWQRATLICAVVGDRGVEERAAELARFAERRVPEGCAVELNLRSLEDIRG
jgi:uncharacterized protein YlxP (DUF503 family)